MRAALLTLTLTLSACRGAAPCVDACEEGREFWEECFDVLVDEYHLVPDCYDDPEAIGALLAEAGDDPERRGEIYQQAWEDGEAHECEDADEVVENCVAKVEGEFRAMDRDAREDRRDECAGEDDDDAMEEAIADRDCDAFVEALGI